MTLPTHAFEAIGHSTWEEVFRDWKDREGADPAWVKVATEVKGWPNWESWRRFTAERFGASTREWSLYRVLDPSTSLPDMVIGPYVGWQEPLPEKNSFTFRQAFGVPGFRQRFFAHTGIRAIIDSFPKATRFIGLVRPDGRIVCVEGHHRAAAVAIANIEGRPLVFGREDLPIIALAALLPGEEDLLDASLARGTQKEPPRN